MSDWECYVGGSLAGAKPTLAEAQFLARNGSGRAVVVNVETGEEWASTDTGWLKTRWANSVRELPRG